MKLGVTTRIETISEQNSVTDIVKRPLGGCYAANDANMAIQNKR